MDAVKCGEKFVVEYVPRFKPQLDVLFRPAHGRTLFNGGVGAGKTMTAGDFIQIECCNYEENFGIAAGATMPAMEKSTILKVIDEIRDRNVWVEWTDYKKEVRFSNGSWFKFQSLDVPTKELEGSELGWLLIDEITACPRPQVFSLLNRVRRQSLHSKKYTLAVKFGLPTDGLLKPGDQGWWDYSRRVLFCGNPPEAGHWLEKEFTSPEDGAGGPLGRVVTMTTYDNKLLTDDYLRNLEAQYPPGTYMHERMILGKFGTKAEGSIYSEYEQSRHLVGPESVPWDKVVTWIGGIDLGHGDPFVFLQAVLTADNSIYIVGEYYSNTPKLMSQHASAIHSLYRPGPIMCDWDGQQRLELRALGITTVAANKDLLMGIHAVRNRFATNKLFVVRGAAPNLLREMPLYTWDAGDRPHKSKEGDHALDAMRYIVAAVDLPLESK